MTTNCKLLETSIPADSLDFGYWDLFGICDLEFEISSE
jgi:hypothetical protein